MANGDTLVSRRPYRLRTSLQPPFKVNGSGIYAIINTINRKVYIGSGVRLNHRWTEHRCNLEDGTHHGRYLQRAFTKNPQDFEIQVIEELPNASKDTIISREQFWMDFYRSYVPGNGYNTCPKANSCQGIKRDPELCKRISKTLKGRKMSPERLEIHKRAMKGHKGPPLTQAQRVSIGQKRRGGKMPDWFGPMMSKKFKDNPPRSCPVLQFSLDGKFIRKFKTITEAEAVFGGRTNIHSVCKGRRRQSLGFVWKYDTDSKETDLSPIRDRRKRVRKTNNG